jgi:3-carboxy-cis,cis-muconate cycloisomerase
MATSDLIDGQIVVEAVMIALAPLLGRGRAHDLVYEICARTTAESGPLIDLLAATVKSRVISTAMRLTDPSKYLGLAAVMVDRVLEKVSRR